MTLASEVWFARSPLSSSSRQIRQCRYGYTLALHPNLDDRGKPYRGNAPQCRHRSGSSGSKDGGQRGATYTWPGAELDCFAPPHRQRSRNPCLLSGQLQRYLRSSNTLAIPNPPLNGRAEYLYESFSDIVRIWEVDVIKLCKEMYARIDRGERLPLTDATAWAKVLAKHAIYAHSRPP